MLKLRFFLLLVVLLVQHVLFANNIRVSTVNWRYLDAINKPTIPLTFKVSWDNSWRDDYNRDAAYVFLKYRLKTRGTKEWHPVYIDNATCSSGDIVCELAPGAPDDKGIGFFIYRSTNGSGPVEANVTINWTLAGNSKEPVYGTDFSAVGVQVVASAIEMVQVPRGPFRAGDSHSRNSFWRDYIPFPSSGDLISESSDLFATSGDAYAVADHLGGSVADTTSCWIPDAESRAEWYVDFSSIGRQMIRYFGFCGARGYSVPSSWCLEATNNMNLSWDVLYTGSSSDWVESYNTAYPPEHTFAIPEDKLKEYTYYRFVIPEVTGTVAVKSISMTAEDIPLARDHSVLIDGETVLLDRERHLGAQDGDSWTGGSTPVGYPTGYKEYYAMKYELSQEQYVDFLNRLSLSQQQSLLPHVSGLSEGDYLFGNPASPTCRNGIVLSRKLSGEPYVFACNLNPLNVAGSVDDGQTLACNYLSMADLLAYASWSGLRPLSELEYEKLSRPLYSYEALPLGGEYAWNTQSLKGPTGLSNAGRKDEFCSGNVNYGGSVGGPLRCGVFALSGEGSREASGAGYWGCFDLSGNLQELYYNVNSGGRQFRGVGFENHGSGYVSPSPIGWPAVIAAFALRGGSFSSVDAGALSVSDRRYHAGALASTVIRDSSVGFRLGRSCVDDEIAVVNTLLMENGQISDGVRVAMDTIVDGGSYRVVGSGADEVGSVYTVLWYKNEDNSAEWSLLDGFTDKDLSLRGVVGKFGRGSVMREYRYRRRLIVPGGECESEVGLCVVDPTYTIDRRKMTLVYGSNSHGVTVTSRNAGLQVRWRDLKSDIELPATTTTETSSYYRARCEDFSDIVLGEEREIELSGCIQGRVFFKDTVTYVVPVPEFNFDKREVTINYGGTAGITMKTNYLVNVTWIDIKSGKILLTSSNVTSSYCHPPWSEFADAEINERRTVRVDIVSVDGCYSRTEEVVMIIPPCMQMNPFSSQPLQTFANTSGSTTVLNVQCDWDSSIPKVWGLQGGCGGISINSSTGQLSGLSGTICNVTVTLADQRCPDKLYTKQVKETYRDITYTGGSKSVILPTGSFQIECWGAKGGQGRYNGVLKGTPGYGGYVKGILTLKQATTIYVYVGGMGGDAPQYYNGGTAGWNGGAVGGGDYDDDAGGGGGGASDIRLVSGNLYSRIMVAAGGGGTGAGVNGGNGGGVTGTAGGGAGGTQTGYSWGVGTAGAYGGNGYLGGGGGGGGYYGGRGEVRSSGGGGSSFISGYSGCNAINSSGTHTGQAVHYSGLSFTSGSMTSGARNANGLVRITVK